MLFLFHIIGATNIMLNDKLMAFLELKGNFKKVGIILNVMLEDNMNAQNTHHSG